ncbi:unnamed protein product [Calypogeia fissa]
MGIPVADSTLRELIPRSNSGRLDESAPLSAPDVIALLQDYSYRLQQRWYKMVQLHSNPSVGSDGGRLRNSHVKNLQGGHEKLVED